MEIFEQFKPVKPGYFNWEIELIDDKGKPVPEAEAKAYWAKKYGLIVPNDPVAYRYQRKIGWGDIWRTTEGCYLPSFENLNDWTIEPLYRQDIKIINPLAHEQTK